MLNIRYQKNTAQNNNKKNYSFPSKDIPLYKKNNNQQTSNKHNKSIPNNLKRPSKLKKIIQTEKEIRNHLWTTENQNESLNIKNQELNSKKNDVVNKAYTQDDELYNLKVLSDAIDNISTISNENLNSEQLKQEIKHIENETDNKNFENIILKNNIINKQEAITNISTSTEAYTYHVFSQHNSSIFIRNYVDHEVDQELNTKVFSFLEKQASFQLRLLNENPQKFNKHMRFILGIKLCTKYLKRKKLKAVFLAPNLEPSITKGGLDEHISNLCTLAASVDTPVIYALSRRGFKRALKFGTKHSAVGIVSAEGAESELKEILKMVLDRKDKYLNNCDIHNTS